MTASTKDVKWVPRVAESIDDIAVGQVIAWKITNREWAVHVVRESRPGGGFWTSAGAGITATVFKVDQIVILSEPTPEPVSVPREAFDRLRQMVDWYEGGQAGTSELSAAVSNLIDAVDGNQ